MKPDRKKGPAKAGRDLPNPRPRQDDPEPSVVPGQLPVWLFVVLAAGLFWGMMYLDSNAGGFNSRVYQRFSSSNELVRLVPFDPVRDSMNRGYAVYTSTCMPCHQPNGQGTPGLFPPLAGSEWVLENDPARLLRIIYNGVSGPIMVKGQQWSLQMPPIGKDANLSDEQLAQVATYIRKSWGNDAPPVTAAEAAAVRKEIGSRNLPWTAADLEQIKLKQ